LLTVKEIIVLHIFVMGRPAGRKQSAIAALRLDPELKEALAQVAEEEDRSVAQVIRVLLREALAARERRRGVPPGRKRKGKVS
jgi:hypothetical protein